MKKQKNIMKIIYKIIKLDTLSKAIYHMILFMDISQVFVISMNLRKIMGKFQKNKKSNVLYNFTIKYFYIIFPLVRFQLCILDVDNFLTLIY